MSITDGDDVITAAIDLAALRFLPQAPVQRLPAAFVPCSPFPNRRSPFAHHSRQIAARPVNTAISGGSRASMEL